MNNHKSKNQAGTHLCGNNALLGRSIVIATIPIECGITNEIQEYPGKITNQTLPQTLTVYSITVHTT